MGMMPEDLAIVMQENGGHELPWESVDSPKMFSWRCRVRQYLVEAYYRPALDAWTIRAAHTEDNTDGESTFVRGEPWRDHALAKLFAEMRAADPRLADLPEDLRAVAEEFLTLHSAWGTEFGVHGHELSFGIDWPGREGEYPRPFAELKFVKHEVNRFGLTTAPWYCAWRVRWVDEDEAGEAVGRLPSLRRSADFADFVQRFRP